MNIEERIKEIIEKESLVYSKPDNLFLFLSTLTGKKIEVIRAQANEMLKKGDLFEIKKGKFIVIPSHGYIKGTFMGSAKGYGFCSNVDKEDVFIPGNMTHGAIDGDEVIVKLFSTDGGSDGEVVKIVKPVKQIVGRIVYAGKNIFLEPDNTKIPFKISVLKTGLKAKINEKVVASLIRRENGKIVCQVIELLGDENDIKSMVLSIVRSHNLYEKFPDEAEKEAKLLNKPVSEKQKKGRLDLTKTVTFTIDGEDARDFDDAVSIKKIGDDFELGVHIADVGEYVKKDSVLDKIAFERGTSTYFPNMVLPMLPKDLSNGICSLNEGVRRLTLSCIMRVSNQGEVKSHTICESVIKSNARLNYTEVQNVLEGKKSTQKAEKFKKQLLLMFELAKILIAKREKRGALDLDIVEPEFLFDENFNVTGVTKRDRKDSHRLIEEFMVIANETVAKQFCADQIPFVYRVHEKPTVEKTKAVLAVLNGLGLAVPPMPKDITAQYIQSLLLLIKGKPYEEALSKIILRSLQKAVYREKNLGHFGLNLEYYCHFTSPIRRYPDLTIHRIIKQFIHKKLTQDKKDELELFTEQSSEQSSQTERNSEKAEREVDDLFKAMLMKDHIGQDYDATITSVQNYGIFVGLDNSVEGLVRIDDLPQDAYLYYERAMELRGQKHSYKIGDSVKVTVANVDLKMRKVDFVLKN